MYIYISIYVLYILYIIHIYIYYMLYSIYIYIHLHVSEIKDSY